MESKLDSTRLESGYLAKFDWFVLKPVWIGMGILAIVYLLKHKWIMGIFFIAMAFLIGVVAASLHKNKKAAELANGYPKLKDALRKETELLNQNDSYKMGKATMGLAIILGLATLVLLLYYKIRWYFAIPLSIVIAWLTPVILFLPFAFLMKSFHKKINKVIGREYPVGYRYFCNDCKKEYPIYNATEQTDYSCPHCKSKNVDMIESID